MGTPVEEAGKSLCLSHVERRLVRRRRTVEEHGVLSARVRPGRLVSLVDVSVNGALVESERQLRPGAVIEIQMSSRDRHVVLRGFVLRCAVSRLGATGVLYQAAIGFAHRHPWFVLDANAGYPMHAGEIAPNAASWAATARLDG